MKTIFIISLIILSIFTFLKAEIIEEDFVLVLDDSNFDEAIKKHKTLLVEFYAPWCGHCKELAPHWAKAAEKLRQDATPLYLAKVDATIATELAKKYQVEGFPTIKFFTGDSNDYAEYQGGRTEEEIISWYRKKTGPAFKELTSAAAVEEFSNANEAVVVFFGVETNLNKIFAETARTYDDIQFAVCGVEECLTKNNVKNGNVVIFKKFDAPRVELSTVFTEEELKTFIDTNSIKLVAPFDERTAQLIFGKQIPGLFFYRTKGSDEKLETIAQNVAEKLKGKIQIVVTDITGELEQRLAEYVGVTAAELPTIRIHDTRKDLKKYNLEGEMTEANILEFVDNWLAGKLVSKLKSEEVPDKQENDVRVLVGKSFVDIVYDTTKDVLVEFYAPWCGHCQQLSPIYEDLAKKLKEANPNLIIAKIDSTANDVEGMDIQGFPTIKFFSKDNKASPIDFEGDRHLSGMTNFLAENIKGFVRGDIPEVSTVKEVGAPEDVEGEGQDEGQDEQAIAVLGGERRRNFGLER